MSLRVLFAGGGTGGHLVPALRLAEQLQVMRPECVIHFAGSKRSFEEPLVSARGFRYTEIPARGFDRRRPWRNIMTVFAAMRAIAASGRLIREFKPDAAIGTGGYASAFPIWVSARRGIPVFLQEQNRKPGLATRRLARRACKVYLAFDGSRQNLPSDVDSRVCGNPVDSQLSTISRTDARANWGIPADAKVVLVTGGSAGARSINRNVIKALTNTPGDGRTLLWQTGRSFQDSIPSNVGWEVQHFEFSDNMTEAMVAADVVIARAGALTLAEIAAAGKPAILVPYPFATDDHQTMNAQAFADAGAAILIPDVQMDHIDLLQRASELLDDLPRLAGMAEAAKGLGRPDAAREIVEDILLGLETPQQHRSATQHVG